MVKKFTQLVSVILVVAVFTACGGSDGKPPIDFAVAQIDVTHFKSGHITNWTIDAQKNISDLEKWFNGLSLQSKRFKEGQSPGDLDGGEVFSFQLGDVDNSFSYIKNGSDQCYILCGQQWYKVKNPQDPFSI